MLPRPHSTYKDTGGSCLKSCLLSTDTAADMTESLSDLSGAALLSDHVGTYSTTMCSRCIVGLCLVLGPVVVDKVARQGSGAENNSTGGNAHVTWLCHHDCCDVKLCCDFPCELDGVAGLTSV